MKLGPPMVKARDGDVACAIGGVTWFGRLGLGKGVVRRRQRGPMMEGKTGVLLSPDTAIGRRRW
jgi:hypothetical protein